MPLSLPRRTPSINNQTTPRHKRARPTQQKDSRTSELLRRRDPPQHIIVAPLLLEARRLFEILPHHRSEDVSGTEGVDADSFWPPLHGEAAG